MATHAEAHDGVISASDAYELGVSRKHIYRWLVQADILRIGRHSLIFPGHPVTWRQNLRAALNDGGQGALVSHRSAAALHGFEGFAREDVEILVARTHRDRSTVGIVHSARRVDLIDRTIVENLPCTSAARTIVDIAGSCTERELEAAIDSAVRLGSTSTQFLARRLGELRHRARPGVRQLDKLMLDSGGTNRLEREFLRICRRAGLPKPGCQVIHRRGNQTVARVDFDFSPNRLVVEVEGQVAHASPQQRQRDAQRRRELAFMGRLVLSYTFEDVFQRPEVVTNEVVSEIKRRN